MSAMYPVYTCQEGGQGDGRKGFSAPASSQHCGYCGHEWDTLLCGYTLTFEFLHTLGRWHHCLRCGKMDYDLRDPVFDVDDRDFG